MKISLHLHVESMFHPRLIDMFGPLRCAKVIKKHRGYLIETYEQIRELAGEPVTVNDYGDDLAYRRAIDAGHPGFSVLKGRKLHMNNGIRIISDPVGTDLSIHYLWDAMTLIFQTVEPGYIKQWILDNSDDFPHIVKMGSDEALHVEVAQARVSDIEVFDP